LSGEYHLIGSYQLKSQPDSILVGVSRGQKQSLSLTNQLSFSAPVPRVRLQQFPFANICKGRLRFLFSFSLRIYENDLQTVFKVKQFESLTQPRHIAFLWACSEVKSLVSSLQMFNKPFIRSEFAQFPTVFGDLGNVTSVDSALFEPHTGKELQ
jgi:hypothetical protein